MGSNATTNNHASKFAHHPVPGKTYSSFVAAIDLAAADPRGLKRCASGFVLYVTTSAKVLSIYPPGSGDKIAMHIPVGVWQLNIQASGLSTDTTCDEVTACYPPG